ncbi:hypothetical protein AIY08_05610 [Salmonella enterica]|nr:hypothetical protein [Salmonella enterica]EBP3817371.1 hypothetical protein [Salmonella enterica subsp. enterica]ECP3267939.1 hypothetical protein [Salmonella enterica subsp. enterica serovar [1],13,23:g,z51:-]ECT1271689.1 hypothetical protein [Salmonella enterica subsp. houtenae serovar 48:g,z51:-]EDT2391480.1 hypothetical protein [Salmonella enterica subsp. arizonae]
MRACYKAPPPDGATLIRPTLPNIAVGRIRHLRRHPALHFYDDIPLVIFCRNMTALSGKSVNSPSTPALLYRISYS